MYTSFQQGEYYFDKRNGKEKLETENGVVVTDQTFGSTETVQPNFNCLVRFK